MKPILLIFVALFACSVILSGCSTFGIGGSVESSATYVTKSSETSASSSSGNSSSSQSKIDMKVQEIKSKQDSKIINKYIRKGL